MYKYLFENKKAALFDLEGTIIDTEDLWTQAFRAVLKNLKIDWVSPSTYFIYGTSVYDFWERLISGEKQNVKMDLTVQQLVDETYKYFLQQLKLSDIDVIEGFWSIARELKLDNKLTIGLVTNTYKKIADVILEKIGAKEIFDLKIYADDVKKLKPDPEIYKKALNQLKIANKEAVVFEDSVAGSDAAVRADIDTIVVLKDTVYKDRYSLKIKEFIPDYVPMIGTTQKTPKEYTAETLARIKQSIQVS